MTETLALHEFGPGNHEESFPLSAAQHGVWTLEQLFPLGSRYHVPSAYRVRGPLDRRVLLLSFEAAVERHESLRTVFRSFAGLPRQVVLPSVHLALPEEQVSGDGEARVAAALERARQEVGRPFDLENGPLLRARVLRLGPDDALVVCTLHHLVADVVSARLLIEEVGVQYEALRRGVRAPLAALPIQFADWSEWHAERLAGETGRVLEDYWRGQHAGRPHHVDLPADRPRPALLSFRGGERRRTLPPALGERVRALARRSSCTLNGVFLTGFAALVERCTGQDDLVIATPVALRERPELAAMIGFLVNTVPVRIAFAGNPTLREALARVQASALAALGHAELPLDRILSVAGAARRPDRAALSQLAFGFHPVWFEPFAVADLEIEPLDLPLGHAATDLLLNVRDRREGFEIVAEYSSDLFDASRIDRLLAHYEDLLARLVADPDQRLAALPAYPLAPPGAEAAASDADVAGEEAWLGTGLTRNQYLLWIAQRLRPGEPVLNEVVRIDLRGALDADRFVRALAREVCRCEALRLVVEENADGRPRAALAEPERLAPVRLDLSDAADPVAALARWLEPWRIQPLDPTAVMFETTLVRLAHDHHVWLVRMHQCVFDATSLALLIERVEAGYQGRAEPEAEVAFADYREHERHLVGTPRWRRAHAYWEEKLGRERDAFPFPPLAGGGPECVRESLGLGAALSGRILALIATEPFRSLTPQLSLLQFIGAVLAAYLHRIGDGRRLAIGTAFQNRAAARFKRTLGSLSHAVPLHVDVEEGDDLASLAGKLELDVFASLQHQGYAPRNPIDAPGFDVFLNNQIAGAGGFAGLELEGHWLSPGRALFPLALSIHDGSHTGALTLELDFAVRHFDAPTRARVTRELLRLLEGCVSEPSRPLAEFSPCGEAEQRSVLGWYNRPVRVEPWSGGVRAALAARVAEAPSRVAVEQGDVRLSYGELWSRSRRVSGWLRAHGVGRGSLVPVRAERGPELLVAWLAVWQAGAAFLPLDPRDPEARVAQLVAQCGAGLVLSDGAQAHAGLGDARWASVAEAEAESPGESVAEPSAAEDLAYAIYTSGSTGTPKAVLIEHGGMDNHLLAKIETLGLGAADVLAQTASPCFDIAVWQSFAPLRAGGRVRVVPDATVRDPEQLLAEWKAGGVTVAEVVPSLLRLVVETLEAGSDPGDLSLRWLVVTGEALPAELCRRWLARYPAIPLVNAYGPTECSDDVTQEVIAAAPEDEIVPVGRPLRNLRAYVVDGRGRLLPPGVTGELWAGGTGVGRGYLDDPARTAAAFAADPWSDVPGARLYRTGDRARFLEDGRLVFHGRCDDQVKLRGFRVELGEVEAALRALPNVADAAAVVVPSSHGPRLRAFVTPKQGGDSDALRSRLADRLPPHMVPALVERLDTMPLGTHGKLDRRALAARAFSDASRGEEAPPRGPLEERLARAFGAVLGCAEVSRDADFLDLGGDSIAAVRLLSLLRREGLNLSPDLLLRHRTVSSLAFALAAHAANPATQAASLATGALWSDIERSALRRLAAVRSGLADLHPATPAQTAMFRSARIAGDPALWLTQTRVVLDGACQPEALEAALGEVVARHAALRASFAEDASGVVVQAVEGAVTPEVDLLAEADGSDALATWAAAQRDAGIDPSRAPLFRLAALPRAGGLELLVTNHHLIHDGWSAGIVLRDLLAALAARCRGEASPLGEAPAFRAHAEWLARRDAAEARTYFSEALRDARWDGALRGFDDDATRAALRAPHAHAWARVDRDVVAALARTLRERRLGWSCLLETAWASVCAATRGTDQALLGLVVAGRGHALPGVDEIVGPLASLLPSQTRLRSGSSLLELAHEAQARSFALALHSDVSPSRLVEWGLMSFEYAFPDGVFAFQNAMASTGPPLGGLRVARVAVAPARTPFPLVLQAFPGSALELALEFDPERGAGRLGGRLLAALAAVLAQVARDPLACSEEVRAAAKRSLESRETEGCVLREGGIDWLPAEPVQQMGGDE